MFAKQMVLLWQERDVGICQPAQKALLNGTPFTVDCSGNAGNLGPWERTWCKEQGCQGPSGAGLWTSHKIQGACMFFEGMGFLICHFVL